MSKFQSLFFLCVLVSLTSLSSIAQDTVTAKEDVHVNKGAYSSNSTGNSLGNLILFGDGSNGGGWQSSIKWSGLDGFNSSISSGTRVNAEITVGNIGSYGKSDLIFKTKGTNDNAVPSEKFRITSLGNIGIGTTSPAAKLQITDQGNSSATTLQLNNRIKFRGDGVMNWGASADYGILSWNTGKAIIGAKTGKDLSILASGSEKMIVKTNGNVGIGTTTPESKLEVGIPHAINQNDEMRIGSYYQNKFIGIGFDYRINEVGITSKHIVEHHGSTSYTPMTFKFGKVGIGTNNPDAKLAVNGNIHTKEVKVDLIGWADYVFKDDYNLPTLQQVEDHIATKGHLINIPSATEVAENGILLGEMNAKLLEKIEELTLYMIQQQKEITELRSMIEKIKKDKN